MPFFFQNVLGFYTMLLLTVYNFLACLQSHMYFDLYVSYIDYWRDIGWPISYCLTEFRKFVQDSENHGVLLRRRDFNGVFITNLADNFAQSCIKLLNDVTTEYMIHEIVFRIVWIYNAWHWSCLLWISMRHKSPMCSFWYSELR